MDEINNIIQKKKELESNISRLINDFESLYGVSVKDISIDKESYVIEGFETDFSVDNCRISININLIKL